MSKVLIFYTSVGLGHKVIAENIAAALEKEGFSVKLADILKVQDGKLVSFGRKLLKFFYKFTPFIWSFLYKSKLITSLTLKFRTKIGGDNSKEVIKLIRKFNPQVIITTQTTASAVVASLIERGLYKGKFGIAFSDFHLHRFWLYEECDFYLVNTQEQKQEMEKLGIEPKKIFVTGFTLKPKAEINKLEIKNKLKINLSDKVILVSSGSQGIGFKKQIFKKISRFANVQIIVVCGNNHKMLQRMEASNGKIIFLSFYPNMEELYAISDVFITKPGGLSVAEALAWDLPIVITHNLPGQEELNAKYLKAKGLAVVWPNNLPNVLKEILFNKKSFQSTDKPLNLIQFGGPAREAVKQVLHGA